MGTEPAEPLEDAEIIVLRREDGTFTAEGSATIGEAGRKRAVEERAKRKAEMEYRVAAANGRAGMLGGKLNAAWANGTANLMLARILSGEIEPKTAKEAAEVAKVAADLAARETGTADAGQQTPAERAERRTEMEALAAELAARAREMGVDAVGAIGGSAPGIPDSDEGPLYAPGSEQSDEGGA